MNVHFPQRIGPFALLLAMLGVLACGGDDAPTEVDIVDDDPNPPATDYQGYAIYAVTLNNRLLLFGSESPTTMSRSLPIVGLPILNRIVGIDFRPSDGKLYGVGNDSRVYIIDPETGVATAVSTEQFTPIIASFFDTHFGMGFDPATERIRLIATESGLNWSIDPDDGTATRGADVHYAAGQPNEGSKPSINGLAYVPASLDLVSARSPGSAAARVAALGNCDHVDSPITALDIETALLILTCDPDEAAFIVLESLEGLNSLFGCGEVKFDPGEGELFASILRGAQQLNNLATIDPETGSINWLGEVPEESPIQAIAFDPNAPVRSGPLNAPGARGLSVAAAGSTSDSDALSCPGAPR